MITTNVTAQSYLDQRWLAGPMTGHVGYFGMDNGHLPHSLTLSVIGKVSKEEREKTRLSSIRENFLDF